MQVGIFNSYINSIDAYFDSDIQYQYTYNGVVRDCNESETIYVSLSSIKEFRTGELTGKIGTVKFKELANYYKPLAEDAQTEFKIEAGKVNIIRMDFEPVEITTEANTTTTTFTTTPETTTYTTTTLETTTTTEMPPKTTTTPDTTTTTETGDFNGDGDIDASDAADVLIVAAKAGAGEDTGLTPEQLVAHDLDGDSQITAGDAAIILQYAAFLGSGGTGTLTEYLAQQ